MASGWKAVGDLALARLRSGLSIPREMRSRSGEIFTENNWRKIQKKYTILYKKWLGDQESNLGS